MNFYTLLLRIAWQIAIVKYCVLCWSRSKQQQQQRHQHHRNPARGEDVKIKPPRALTQWPKIVLVDSPRIRFDTYVRLTSTDLTLGTAAVSISRTSRTVPQLECVLFPVRPGCEARVYKEILWHTSPEVHLADARPRGQITHTAGVVVAPLLPACSARSVSHHVRNGKHICHDGNCGLHLDAVLRAVGDGYACVCVCVSTACFRFGFDELVVLFGAGTTPGPTHIVCCRNWYDRGIASVCVCVVCQRPGELRKSPTTS